MHTSICSSCSYKCAEVCIYMCAHHLVTACSILCIAVWQRVTDFKCPFVFIEFRRTVRRICPLRSRRRYTFPLMSRLLLISILSSLQEAIRSSWTNQKLFHDVFSYSYRSLQKLVVVNFARFFERFLCDYKWEKLRLFYIKQKYLLYKKYI